eukprot:TRINITY_DN2484_c1_g1_i1.p1 TRINITY_DN2484_c1_g1~~TRINITY_DN2484_c1_g1_i1.p1  ORF type:complete len:815 (+),score=132.74 TRINITY_DN2484_c1_g1_i1:180-2624(+)
MLAALIAITLGYDWSLETGSSTQIGTPTTWNGNVYVLTNGDDKVTNQGLIMSINEETGGLKWFAGIGIYSSRLPDPIVFETSPDAGLLIAVTSTPAQIQAFDASGRSYYANWTFSYPKVETFSKAVVGDNDCIYVTSGPPPGHLFAIDAANGPNPNGTAIWKQTFPAGVLSPPLYVPGFVIVTTRDCVYAYHSSKGQAAWEHHIKGNPGVDSPTASFGEENLIFVSSMEGLAGHENPYHIYALDAATGKQRWSASGIGSYSVSTPVYSKQGIVVFTSWTDGGNITALNSSTGETIWSHTDAHNLVNFSTPVIDDDAKVLYVVASTSSPSISLWEFMLEDGTFTWEHVINTAASCASGDGCISPIPSPPYSPHIDTKYKTALVPGINRDVYAVSLPAAPSPDHTTAPASESVPTYVGYIAAVSGIIVVSLVLCLPRWWCKGRNATQVDTSQPPSPESRYTAIRKLGSGSYGTVYEVKCKKDGKLYALKRIPCDNETERTEAIREWRILCGIQHPNKIQAYETFMNWSTMRADEDDIANINTVTHRRYVCIVMQYCPEGDLKNYIQSFGPNQRIPESVVLSFAGQLCSVMSVLHAQVPPLIHRDLKPENVLLDQDNTKVIVTDFGLARPLSGSLYCKTHAGTLAFIAPETWDRHYSTGADMWGIGCIMYAMTTKRVSKENCRCLWREANEPEFQIGISDELVALGYSTTLANIVAQLLTPNRKRRPSAVQAFQWLHSYVPSFSKKYSLLGSDGPHEEVPVFVRAPSRGTEGSDDSLNQTPPTQHHKYDQSLPESHCQLDIAVDGESGERVPLLHDD